MTGGYISATYCQIVHFNTLYVSSGKSNLSTCSGKNCWVVVGANHSRPVCGQNPDIHVNYVWEIMVHIK